MELNTILPWAVFAICTLGVWALISAFQKEDNRATERLAELRDPGGRDKKRKSGSSVSQMFEKAAPALSAALGSKSDLEKNELRVRLANAGYNQSSATQTYLAIRVAMLGVGALAGGGGGMLVYGMTQKGYFAIAITAGIFFFLPELVLSFMASGRKQKLFLSLPDALDLLVVCVEAGLGLDAGMRRISEELHDTHKEMCDELDLCNLQIQMGRVRRDVLHDLGIRTGVDDIKALAAILIQAERFGSSIAQALRVQSDCMRVKRRQIAEEKAQKTAVQMLFPMVLFIFPGIFVVLVGPAAIKMMAAGVAG
ncbi:MAG TPA: type II secretion system F family protein [Schlesneria sp.]|jgi:tight adherence protein C